LRSEAVREVKFTVDHYTAIIVYESENG